jgi:hypothetical protein
MKNIKKFSVAALIIVTNILSQNAAASSYPSSGMGVSNSSTGNQTSPSSSSASSGYVAPTASIDPVVLGGDGSSGSPWEIIKAGGALGDDVGSSNPETDIANGIAYYVCSTGAFKVGDYVTIDGGLYILQASSYTGYLKAVGTGADVGLGSYGDYFQTPIANGNIILAVLILTYGFYIFYRKKKKEQSSIEVKKAIL